MKIGLATFLLSSLAANVRGAVSYDGYRVYRITTYEDVDVVNKRIESLATVTLNLNISEHIDIAVGPDDIAAFEALNLDVEVLHKDLGVDIAKESMVATHAADFSAAALPDLSWFNAYHPYVDHVRYFTALQANFANNSQLFTAGTSYQGHSIFGIHLWGSGGKGSKPAIYFHGTVHAREWIGAMVIEYITYQLIHGYRNDTSVQALVDAYDFYILPFVNPDGFVYSQTEDRLWRKSRQPRDGTTCIGTDINRNWPYHWDDSPPGRGGASPDPCRETYRGASAGDTPENKGLVAFTKELASTGGRQGIRLFVDWHAYGQYLLLPYGYNCSARTANHERQMALANGTAAAIAERYSTTFKYGPSCQTLYGTTGDSVDYMTDVAGAEVAWTIELRPGSRAFGTTFILPPEEILPSALEQWDGMKYLLSNI